MKQYAIYIGLKDAVSHEQRFDTGKYQSVLKNVCRSYHTAFSVHIVEGGYFHDDGTYVDETTLVLTVLDAEPAVVREIAGDLCAFFHQESVMVTVSDAEVFFIRDNVGEIPPPAGDKGRAQ